MANSGAANTTAGHDEITWRPGKAIPRPPERTEEQTRPRISQTLMHLARPLELTGAADHDRRARLLVVLSLVQAAVAASGAFETAIFSPPRTAAMLFPILGVTSAVYAVVWSIARRGRVEAAAWTTVVLQLVVPATIAIAVGGGVNAMSTASWATLALLTTNALLGARAVLTVGAVATMLTTSALFLAGAGAGPIFEAALFLGSSSTVLSVYARHRERVEADRAAVLRTRNQELETVRSKLEIRVAQRTFDLTRTAEELQRTCNALTANQCALVQTERMAVIGRLSAGFAHALATPLSAIVAATGSIESLCDEYEHAIGDSAVTHQDHRAIATEMREALATVTAASGRATTFVRGIAAHARDAGASSIETFDARVALRHAAELVAYQARVARVALTTGLPTGDVLSLRGIPSRRQQAATNPLQNAVDAAAERGKGRVHLSARRDAAVGLSIVRDVVTELGGAI